MTTPLFFAFVLGMAIGGFNADRTSSQISVRDVPPIWRKRFGKSRTKRYAATFFGGFLILFGSRLAGGCTLELFISGSTQLALSGLYFGVVIFAVTVAAPAVGFGVCTWIIGKLWASDDRVVSFERGPDSGGSSGQSSCKKARGG